ncbi:hypothetical protein JAAARDRAFT_206847 [Jaapia argillacea MUCL 33604]|uniref:Protein kinase domain-containing protein n=1 Tax=Jaapia argillacea MUCL 33604 TaxID=933084 RepID=A0A067Q3T0_9AGAM|nr:hypothetical protein JAAARDRAFT_206847 [Jaapia argillacea MUCL 33604]
MSLEVDDHRRLTVIPESPGSYRLLTLASARHTELAVVHTSHGLGGVIEHLSCLLGKRVEVVVNRIAYGLGAGPHKATQRIEKILGKQREAIESKLDDLHATLRDSDGADNELKLEALWMKCLQTDCRKLIDYAHWRNPPSTRLQTFECIVTLCTAYPGARQLLRRLVTVPATNNNQSKTQAHLLGWESQNEEESPLEWVWKMQFAAFCVLDNEVTCEVEHCYPRELGLLDGQVRGVTETLLARITDDHPDYPKFIAIRYLGGILGLSTFWKNRERERLFSLVGKMCDAAMRLIEDMDINRHDVDISHQRIVMDITGIDRFASSILVGVRDCLLPDCSRISSLLRLTQLLQSDCGSALFPTASSIAPFVQQHIAPGLKDTYSQEFLSVTVEGDNHGLRADPIAAAPTTAPPVLTIPLNDESDNTEIPYGRPDNVQDEFTNFTPAETHPPPDLTDPSSIPASPPVLTEPLNDESDNTEIPPHEGPEDALITFTPAETRPPPDLTDPTPTPASPPALTVPFNEESDNTKVPPLGGPEDAQDAFTTFTPVEKHSPCVTDSILNAHPHCWNKDSANCLPSVAASSYTNGPSPDAQGNGVSDDVSPLDGDISYEVEVDVVHSCDPPNERSQDLTGLVEISGQLAIGSGVLSDVYRGVYQSPNSKSRISKSRIVAIKVFRSDLRPEGINISQAQVGQRIIRESKAWSSLSHPNVLPYLGYAEFEGRIALISPFCSYGTIMDHLATDPMANRMSLIQSIASGMTYLHSLSRPVVHGDLKSNNILVDEHKCARICDFGILKVQGDDATYLTWLAAGSSCYMAPELHRELDDADSESELEPTGGVMLPCSLQSDVYALGIVFFEVLTGLTPFTKGLLDVQIVSHVKMGRRPSRARNTDKRISNKIWALMEKCWKQEPNERPTMQQVMQSL